MVVPVYRNKMERWREIKNTTETCRLIHSDLKGLCCTHSHSSFCYMLLFIDEKSDVFSKCTVECVFKEKTGHLKIDNGRGFPFICHEKTLKESSLVPMHHSKMER